MAEQQTSQVIVVDLDHTLICTDLFYESLVRSIKLSPLKTFLALFLVFKGRHLLKRKLADMVTIDATILPYNALVINYIKKWKDAGSKIVLASAADSRYVEAVAQHLGLFDEFFGSHQSNLKGTEKLRHLKSRFAQEEMTYIGDSFADLRLWEAGLKAVVVNPSRALRNTLNSRGISYEELSTPSSFLKALFKACRIHQWVKNLLILLPIVAAGRFSDAASWLHSILAIGAFSFLASSVYIINDITDLESDRKHPTKSKRPFASGNLSVSYALLLLPGLIGASLALASFLPRDFYLIMSLYFGLNLMYSFKLKRLVAIDVIALASMYSLRVMAGGIATGITVSQWLLAFCVTFFFGLAVLKRFTEVAKLLSNRISGRGYVREDKYTLLGLGIAGSLLSSLVFILYIRSDTVTQVYSNPEALWVIALLLLYWVSRIWLLAGRGMVDEDPVLFAVKDRVTYVVAVSVLAVLYAAH
jgi:4-hydroxybenzoate polyprenyltransferase/phosphoserine phosphatase